MFEPPAPKTPRLGDEPPPEPERAAWVHVGGGLLYVGGESGTIVSPATAPEHEQRALLAEALADMKAQPLETAERLFEAGEAVTDRVEQVTEALDLVLSGADIEQVVDQLDGWIGELHKRYGDGDYQGVIRLVRVLTGLLTLAFRWRDLVAVLSLGVAAAHQVGNVAAEAWALRELGSLAVVSGNRPLAADLLGRATGLFERAGDHDAAQQATANLNQALTEAAPPPPPGGGSLVERVARHKLAVGAVTAAGVLAVLAIVLLPGSDPSAEIVAFSTASTKSAPGARDDERGQELPATAVDPGGVVEACDPLYLVAYVRYSNMPEGLGVRNEAKVVGKFDATQSYGWSGPADFSEASLAYVHTDQSPDESSGEALPEGRWQFTVTLDGELSADETVTLRNACP